MLRWFFAFALIICPQAGWATDCNTDCHDRCRRCLLGACAIEPTCHLQCEAEKKASCAISTPIPHIPSPAEVLNPNVPCSVPYENFVHATIAYCANWGGRADDLNLIQNAADTLGNLGIVDRSAFGGVDIRWCPLNGSGMVPDRDRILLHPDLKQNAIALAATLAHEMKHIEQYRRWGPDDFKCRYSGELIRGHQQGRDNYIEREAYEFEDSARARLAGFGGGYSTPPVPPPPVLGNRCGTPVGVCPMPNWFPAGSGCMCPTGGGPIAGQVF